MNSLLKSKTTRWLFVGIALLFLAACTQPGDNGDGDGNGVPDSVTLTVNVTGSGTVAAVDEDGAAVVVTGDDQTTFNPEEGAVVTVTATPAEGFEFTGWGGDTTCTDGATCDVVMDQNRTLTATFTEAGDPGDPGDPGEPGEPGETSEATTEITDVANDSEQLVGTSTDDATAYPAGFNYRTSSDLDLGFDVSHGTNQYIGLFFDGVELPEGDAELTAAYIEFTAAAPAGDQETSAGDQVVVQVALDSALAPETLVQDVSGTPSSDLSNRDTSEAITWTITDAWTAGEAYRSENILPLIQDQIDAGWTSGGDLVFVLFSEETANYRRAESAGTDRTGPVLVLEYTVPSDGGSDGAGDGEGDA